MAWPMSGGRGEAELLDGRLGVGDIRLAGVRALGGLVAAAVAALVEARRRGGARRASGRWPPSARRGPSGRGAAARPGRCSALGRAVLGGSANSQAARRTPPAPGHIDAPHHVPWHPLRSSIAARHRAPRPQLSNLYSNNGVPARNTPRSSDHASRIDRRRRGEIFSGRRTARGKRSAGNDPGSSGLRVGTGEDRPRRRAAPGPSMSVGVRDGLRRSAADRGAGPRAPDHARADATGRASAVDGEPGS